MPHQQSSLHQFTRFAWATPATTALCAAMTVVYVVTAVQSGSIGGNLYNSPLADQWVLSYTDVAGHPFGPLRAVGYALLHGGPSHLVMNALLIFFIGREIESFLGTTLTALVLVAGCIGSAGAILVFDPWRTTVGASGIGYALMGVLVGVVLRRDAALGWRSGQVRGALVLIAANLGFTLLDFGASLWGHVGGLAAGAFMAIPIAAGAGRRGIALSALVACALGAARVIMVALAGSSDMLG